VTVCTTEAIEFTRCQRRKVVADFGGGEITSDAGVLLLSEAEYRIKEQQLDLFADRASCMNWLPNQLRVLLSGLAYTLMAAVRRSALSGTKLALACCGTIRLKLLKIGAVIGRNTRRVHLMLSTACPYQELFIRAVNRLRVT
jgi:hypothetical protein